MTAGEEKAAVLLLTFGPEVAAGVLRHLSEPEVRQLSTAIARLRTIPREQAAAVNEEAWRWLSNREGFLVDGERFVRELIEREPGARPILRELAGPGVASTLEQLAPAAAAQMLVGEHPQVMAFILAHLSPPQAAAVLSELPAEVVPDIVERIADLKVVSGDLIAEVSAVLEGQVQGLRATAQGTSLGGARTAAEILSRLDPAVEERILARIDETAPELGAQVRSLMLTFEDLARLDARGMQTLLREISRDELLLALKTASPAMREKVFANMAHTAAEILRDDLGTMGPVRLRDVEQAQAAIVLAARRLEAEHKLTLGRSTSDELV